MDIEGEILRCSLVGNGFIGELYDVRTEKFSSRSLLKSSLPENLIQKRDSYRTEINYQFTENLSDRFELLKVDAEVQVSVLCGLMKVNGSGKFLTEEKKSEKTVSCSLICKYLTVTERLFSSFDEIINHLDLNALQSPHFTHVITEINWGANCLLTLEAKCTSECEKKVIKGALEGEISKLKFLLNPSGKGDLKKENVDSNKKSNYSVKVCADVLSDKPLPTTVESFLDFVSEIPKLLTKVNNGKGKPLNYVMVPLSGIKKAARLDTCVDVIVKTIDESFLISIVYLFDEINSVKRNIYDLLQEMTEFKKYVKKKTVIATQKKLEQLKLEESELKLIISEDWVKVRSGEKSLKEFIRHIEKFKAQELKLYIFEEFVESCMDIRGRISAIKNYLSAGALYLGVGEKFVDLVNRFLSFDFIVLVRSDEMEKNDIELYQNTCHYFLTLVHDPVPKTKYVVFDLDIDGNHQFSNFEIKTPKIFHFKGMDIVSGDIYGDYVKDRNSNFMRLKKEKEIEPLEHRPGNRVFVEVSCPGFLKASCKAEKIKWLCFRCKSCLEYGFDNYFYCLCGRGPISAYEYRCSDVKHGNEFYQAEDKFLNEQISLLRPFKELNILILGQSGVGKSTWINSITNYLSYDSLQEAKEGGVICEIPLNVTAYSKSLKKFTIRVGGKKDNEVTTAGESATQRCHTYSFLWEDRYVRLIDTPGLGDTRGIEQDKKNMKNIISHIGNLKELHGICILIKANENRITPLFSYCLKELLIHMHKSVAKNIVFCFTNARNSFYTPGQVSSFLDNLLDKIDVRNELSLGPHSMFCLDNEAFLFLCTLSEPEIYYDELLIHSFEQSWEISSKETRRMFNTIKNFRPHHLKDTLSLVTSRTRILLLTKPIADISKIIQMNVSAIEKKRDEITNFDKTIDDLKSKLNIETYKLEATPLNYPRTVCTSSSCVKYVFETGSDYQTIEYIKHCHERCYISNVVEKVTNNALLKNCKAIRNGKCRNCGCGWEKHMHISYSQTLKKYPMENLKVKEDLLKEMSDKEKREEFLKSIEEVTEKYKKEQEIILQTSVKFGMFLKQNAISVYNDSIADYLKYLIEEEENKPFKSEEEENVLKRLKETLKAYEAEVIILQNVVTKGENEVELLTSQQVFQLEESLYQLELTGADIKKSVEAGKASADSAYIYSETPLKITSKNELQKKNKSKNKFFNIFK